MADGTPQLTPLWFNSDGEYILINSAKGRIKDKNMRARPAVAVVIQDPKDQNRYIQIRGRVVEITEEGCSRTHRPPFSEIQKETLAARSRSGSCLLQNPTRERLRGCLILMELHNFLRSRRSIRRFRPEPIEDAVIERILTTATYAPSAHNRQPWRFCVIKDPGCQVASRRRHGC